MGPGFGPLVRCEEPCHAVEPEVDRTALREENRPRPSPITLNSNLVVLIWRYLESN